MTPASARLPSSPALVRLERLAALTEDERAALETATAETKHVANRRELMGAGDPIRQPSLLLSGWACRFRDLRDGRRQILDFVLPGELIGLCQRREPRALSSTMALTALTVCPAPPASPASGLAEAYAQSAALSEAALLRQITRLGRLNALQRITDLLLDLHERLLVSGSAQPTSFTLPLTQETLADALGLTPVHVNRTLQVMRREGVLTLGGGVAHLSNLPKMRELLAACQEYL